MFLHFKVDKKVYFDNIYDCMLMKSNCDLTWKIMHAVVPTDKFLLIVVLL